MLFFKPCAYIDYVPCKLSEGDVWFIYYYVKDPETGRLKRIRKKINRIRPVKERRKAANVLMAEINHRLALGWNPLLELKAPQAGTRLFDAFDAFLTIKAKEMEHDSLRSYRSFIKTFRTWLEKRGLDGNAYCSAVTRTVARPSWTDSRPSSARRPTTITSPSTARGGITAEKRLYPSEAESDDPGG